MECPVSSGYIVLLFHVQLRRNLPVITKATAAAAATYGWREVNTP